MSDDFYFYVGLGLCGLIFVQLVFVCRALIDHITDIEGGD